MIGIIGVINVSYVAYKSYKIYKIYKSYKFYKSQLGLGVMWRVWIECREEEGSVRKAGMRGNFLAEML